MDVEHSKMLAGEAGRRAVFVNGRRSDGKRGRQGSYRLGQLFNGLIVLRGDGLNQVSGQRDAGRHRQTLARGVAESDGLRSKERALPRFCEGNNLFHFYPSTLLPKQRDFAGVAVNTDKDAIGDALGGLAGADDARDAVLTRDNRRM